jgi:hypothetical protein
MKKEHEEKLRPAVAEWRAVRAVFDAAIKADEVLARLHGTMKVHADGQGCDYPETYRTPKLTEHLSAAQGVVVKLLWAAFPERENDGGTLSEAQLGKAVAEWRDAVTECEVKPGQALSTELLCRVGDAQDTAVKLLFDMFPES